MSNPKLHDSVADPLLQEAITSGARSSGKVVTHLFLFIGLGLVVLRIQCSNFVGDIKLHLALPEPPVLMAANLASLPSFSWWPGRLPSGSVATPQRCSSASWATVSKEVLRQQVKARETVEALGEVMQLQHQVTKQAPLESTTLSEYVTMNNGLKMPRLMYRPACAALTVEAMNKRCESFVLSAVSAGFRGIDTAYASDRVFSAEPGIGEALSALFSSGVARESLFIQAKVDPDYTFRATANIQTQVMDSIADSLANLGLDYVDSLLLHWPGANHSQTMEAWRAMEGVAQAGLARQLGISNVRDLETVQRVYEDAILKPAVVQSRAVKLLHWPELHEWRAKVGIQFQPFGMASEYRRFSDSKIMQGLSEKYGVSPLVLIVRFVMGQDAMPLIFTPSCDEMAEDLSALQVPLTSQDAELIDCHLRSEVV